MERARDGRSLMVINRLAVPKGSSKLEWLSITTVLPAHKNVYLWICYTIFTGDFFFLQTVFFLNKRQMVNGGSSSQIIQPGTYVPK